MNEKPNIFGILQKKKITEKCNILDREQAEIHNSVTHISKFYLLLTGQLGCKRNNRTQAYFIHTLSISQNKKTTNNHLLIQRRIGRVIIHLRWRVRSLLSCAVFQHRIVFLLSHTYVCRPSKFAYVIQ